MLFTNLVDKIYNLKKQKVLLLGPSIELVKNIQENYINYFLTVIFIHKR